MRTWLGRCVLPATIATVLLGCATAPTGPSVMVLPGTGKSFGEFQVDNAACRDWAAQQIGTTPSAAATTSAVTGAVVGSGLGAATGAAIGAAAGNPGIGAAVGAGAGLLTGSAVGGGYAAQAGASVQQRYDYAYMQCMYANGHQIPMAAAPARPPRSYAARPPPPWSAPPPPPSSWSAPSRVPPPPAGTPPPPPTGSLPPPPPAGTPPPPPPDAG